MLILDKSIPLLILNERELSNDSPFRPQEGVFEAIISQNFLKTNDFLHKIEKSIMIISVRLIR